MISTVLGIDASGKAASCAVFREGRLLAETSFMTNLTHSQIILPTALRTLNDAGISLEDVDLYAVSAGPGSYTGLRIGIAAVKGLCATGKRCIGVSTLEAMAYNTSQKGLIIPVIHARPGVSYYGGYIFDGEKITEYASDRVGEDIGIKALADGFDGDIIISGSTAGEIVSSIFSEYKNVRAAMPDQCMMRAAGVCLAAINRPDEAGPPEALRARYLQNTMAEKLKDREAAK